MPETFRAPIGTQDVLPPASARWQALIATFAGVAERFGYGLVQGPLFEDIGVFQRIGEGTDVVRKEMYDFLDKGDRHMALRPEGTASVARAYVQHRPPTPWKVWYARAQLPLRAAPGRPLPPAPPGRRRGDRLGRPRRRRRGHRARLCDFYDAIGLRRWRLVAQLDGHPGGSHATSRTRSGRASGTAPATSPPRTARRSRAIPLRVLDSKRPETAAVVAGAPRISDVLDAGVAGPLRAGAGGPRRARHPVHARAPPRARARLLHAHRCSSSRASALDAAADHRSAAAALRRPGRGARRAAHPGHRVRLGHRAHAAGVRRRGRLRRPRHRARRVRRRRHRRRPRPATSPTSCARAGIARRPGVRRPVA